MEQQMKGIALKSKQSEETESELERTIKELQIELRRTANEAMMARLNEY